MNTIRLLQMFLYLFPLPEKERGRNLIPLLLVLPLFLLSFLPEVSFGAFATKDSGTSGAAFLKIGAGARPAAMGGAYSAVADDANAIYWNTAGLANIKGKNEFVAMRAEMFQDMKYNFFAFAHPTKKWGTIGAALNNLNITDIEQRSADSDDPDSTFSSNDSAYTLAYAQKIPLRRFGLSIPTEEDAGIYLGLGIKYIRQNLSGEVANSIATDIGSLYYFQEIPLSLALSVQNLGTKSKFKNESDPLPLTIRLGSSYRVGRTWRISGVESVNGRIKTGLLIALDADFPRDNDPFARLGTEFTHGWSERTSASVRAGYETGRNRQIEGTGSGVSAGAGINYRAFSFDFAWVPFGDLGNTFRYSVKLRF